MLRRGGKPLGRMRPFTAAEALHAGNPGTRGADPGTDAVTTPSNDSFPDTVRPDFFIITGKTPLFKTKQQISAKKRRYFDADCTLRGDRRFAAASFFAALGPGQGRPGRTRIHAAYRPDKKPVFVRHGRLCYAVGIADRRGSPGTPTPRRMQCRDGGS